MNFFPQIGVSIESMLAADPVRALGFGAGFQGWVPDLDVKKPTCPLNADVALNQELHNPCKLVAAELERPTQMTFQGTLWKGHLGWLSEERQSWGPLQ